MHLRSIKEAIQSLFSTFVIMELEYLAKLPETFDGSSIFLFVHSDDLNAKAVLPECIQEDFKAMNGTSVVLYEPSLVHLHHPSCARIALVGTDIQEGSEAPVNKEKFRSAVCNAIKLAKRQHWSRVLFMLPPNHDAYTMLHEAAVVSLLADFELLDAHVTMEERKPFHVKKVVFTVKSPFASGQAPEELDAKIDIEEAKRSVEAGKRMGMSCLYAREIANGRGDDAHPAYFEEECWRLSKTYDSLRIEVIDFEDMKEKGLGLIAAVGQGATIPPRIIFVEYNGNPSSEDRIAIVGKGVTFDSGGLHLKPSAFIDNMHLDKHGAATVMGVMKWICLTAPSVNVLGVLALAENAIDAKSYKPQAILKSYKGLTVEVGNTDAEVSASDRNQQIVHQCHFYHDCRCHYRSFVCAHTCVCAWYGVCLCLLALGTALSCGCNVICSEKLQRDYTHD
jgi:leucyl aminopeptidase